MDFKKTTAEKLVKENLVLKAKLVLIKNFLLKSNPDKGAAKQMLDILEQVESSAEPTVDMFLDTMKNVAESQGFEEMMESLNKQINNIKI